MNQDPPDDNVLISVVIPTRHRNNLLAECLECLRPNRQTIGIANYEVIVSDDGESSTAEEMVAERFPWVRWVAGHRCGPAANRNNGARDSSGKWLAFTDDDCRPDEDWLLRFAERIEQIESDLLGGSNSPRVLEGRTYADRPRRTLAEFSPLNENGGKLWSCNLVLRADLFEELQGFDERYPFASMEDVDLWQRLKSRGEPTEFVQSACVCHPWRKRSGWKRLSQSRRSLEIYLDIHPHERSRVTFISHLRASAHNFVYETWPGILAFRGAGLPAALKEHASDIMTAVGLLRR